MRPIVTYNDAVCSMVVAIRNKATDAFSASTVLAIMFDMEKEDTLDSIIKVIDADNKKIEVGKTKCGASNPRK